MQQETESSSQPCEVYAVEISRVVDQRRHRVFAFMKAHAEELAQQGAVVVSFRHRGSRMVGPYYRLTLRHGQVQQSVYLGADTEFVAEVRLALQKIQEPRQERRALRQYKQTIRKALAQCRAELRQELGRRGLRLHGYEVRGWQTPGPRVAAADRDQKGHERSQNVLPVPVSEEPPDVGQDRDGDAGAALASPG